MRVWHYNEILYMERKWNLIISWRYVSLPMNRGDNKTGFLLYRQVFKYSDLENFENIVFLRVIINQIQGTNLIGSE
jgi:hypothetical protein